MKKNKNALTLIILLTVLAVFTAAYILLKPSTEEAASTSEETESISLLSVDKESVKEISYSYNGADLSFSKNESGWQYDADADFPLTGSYLDTMAEALSSAKAQKKIETPDEISVYGLDSPAISVRAGYTDGTSHSFALGNYSTVGAGYYLSFDGDIYLVDNSFSDAFSHELYDLLTTTSLELSFDSEDVKTISVNDTEITDEEKLSLMKEALAKMKQGDVAAYKDSASLGFDGSESKVTVVYTTETTVDGETATEDNTVAFYINTDGTSGYLMLPGDELVYYISDAEAFYPESR